MLDRGHGGVRRRGFFGSVGDYVRTPIRGGVVETVESLVNAVPPSASTSALAGGSVTYSQAISAADGTPVAGAGFTVPAGLWVATLSVAGDWDDIFGAVDVVTGGSSSTVGGWLAHRPNGSAWALGSMALGHVTGGAEVTPYAAVDGSGGESVEVTVKFDPAAAS